MAKRAKGASRARAREEALAAALAVRVPERADVAVVGGGASGLVAAIAAAEAGASVVVLERDLACGRTILATGNGRCNLANARLEPGRYNEGAFVEAVCGKPERWLADVRAFFEACGLAVVEEGGGRLYPLSRQASSVREVLLRRARRSGVVLAPAREVTAVQGYQGQYRITSRLCPSDGSNREVMRHEAVYTAGTVVLAAGGGEALVRKLGLACAPYQPVLCPLACEAPSGISLDALDGRRAHAVARLLRNGCEASCEEGEVLFRSYGLSGIAVFDLSRAARPGDVVALDLTCGMDPALARKLTGAAGGLAGLIDPVIATALGESLGHARDLRFVVTGPAEAERAQVTRGGLEVGQFLPQTLEAREAPGLFACGEALNVDGACGGFNLAWAWKSGLVAGAAAATRSRG